MEVKSGMSCSEFWVTLLVQFVSVFLFVGVKERMEKR